MRRAIKLPVAALSVAAGLLVSLAIAPSAHARLEECSSSQFCLWEHSYGRGRLLIPSDSGDGLEDFARKNFNDIASSARNGTKRYWCVYQHADFKGEMLLRIPPQGSVYQFGNKINDRASSARVC